VGAYEVAGLRVEIVEGDITEADVDAIANAANNALWMGAGVAGAIKRRGGEQIEREAVARGPIEVGSAVATGAGDLPHKCVIHGAVMGQDLATDAQLVAKTTRSCLELAGQLGVQSLALPAFGTGVGGFDAGECATIMMQAVEDSAPRLSSLRRVALVLFGAEMHGKFERAAEAAWGAGSS
jgi:O-acetyl-ADP-ribose deacetylase (regulator of RNase III)